MKIRVTKEFTFEMAHALYGYDGPCKNIHGHSYKLYITVIGTPLNEEGNTKNGMVIDFSELKKIVKEHIIDQMDHALVLNGNSPHKNKQNSNEFDKTILTPYQPTCENLVIDFQQRIAKHLPNTIKLYSIKLYETATSYAEWYQTDN